MQKQQGMLVVIDGPSGSGKDSLISALVTELSSRGELFFLLSEDVLDENRNEILKERERGKSSGGSGDKEMAMVLVEHRSDIYKRFAEPHLDVGYTVIANRGEPATLAYQTARNELTMEAIWDMHRREGIPIPNLAVLTTCSARTALQRQGQFLENSVFQCLRPDYEISYFRGKSGREIDLVLNSKIALEIKNTASRRDFENLKRITRSSSLKESYVVSLNYSDLDKVILAQDL